MQLHHLSTGRPRKKRKRVGRGGKRGTYSGRGQKGQRARAGHRIRPASRDLFMRIPKLRGVKHKRVTPRAVPLNVGGLAGLGAAEITREVLFARGWIRDLRTRVKVLGGGEIRTAVTVKGIPVSASARKKIEAAGGKVLGEWPGLAAEQLYEGRDLAVTTDFRDVFAEIAARQLGARNLEKVFPGFAADRARWRGVLA